MRKRKRQIRLPTDREIALMLSRIRHPRNQLIVVLALKLGLRASEIANLRLSGVDWEKKTISFVGKGNKSATLPLSDEVIGYLERALKVRPTNCQHDFLIWNFRDEHKGITRFTVHYHVQKAGADIGLENNWKIREWPCSIEDVQDKSPAWMRANANLGMQFLNDKEEVMAVLHTNGYLYCKGIRRLEELPQ